MEEETGKPSQLLAFGTVKCSGECPGDALSVCESVPHCSLIFTYSACFRDPAGAPTPIPPAVDMHWLLGPTGKELFPGL